MPFVKVSLLIERDVIGRYIVWRTIKGCWIVLVPFREEREGGRFLYG